jgi:hypothetical protein
MLYSAQDKTLLETIAPGLIRPDGQRLTEERLAFLGKLVGTTQDGSPVEKVAVVFFMEEEAQPFLDACKRYGVECRAMQMSTGREVVLVEGSRVQQGQGAAPSGVLLPVFREAAWPHLATVVHRPLFNQPKVEGPWVTFAIDLGAQLARLNPSELEKRSLEQIEAEALANLSKRTFKPELKDNAVLLLEEYAPEALLLKPVREQILSLLGTPLFLAAAGKEGIVMAAKPTPNPGIIQVAEMMFRDAKGRRISPLPFLVDANGIVGFASFAPPEDAPQEKPWWKFW